MCSRYPPGGKAGRRLQTLDSQNLPSFKILLTEANLALKLNGFLLPENEGFLLERTFLEGSTFGLLF